MTDKATLTVVDKTIVIESTEEKPKSWIVMSPDKSEVTVFTGTNGEVLSKRAAEYGRELYGPLNFIIQADTGNYNFSGSALGKEAAQNGSLQ